LEGTLKIICFQPPCHEQGHLPVDQVVINNVQSITVYCLAFPLSAGLRKWSFRGRLRKAGPSISQWNRSR